MKRLMLLPALTLSLGLSLIGSQAAFAQSAPGLRTGIEASFPPHAMPKLGGGAEGFNIDLGNAIAEQLHRGITIDLVNFATLIPGLQAGRYDFLVAVVTVTPERAENMLFTEGYLATNLQFAIRKGGKSIKSFDDLKGLKVSVNKGTAYEAWANNNAAKYGFTIVTYDTSPDAIQAVLTNQADANIAANTVLKYAASKNPQLVLDFAIPDTKSQFAFPVRKDNVALRNQIEDALECLKQNGTLAKLSTKWFGFEPAADDAEKTISPGYGIPGLPGYDPTPHQVHCH